MTTDRYSALCRVAGNVSRETFERLEEFERIFLRWASRINLAAPSTMPDVWTRHILDSAQLAAISAACSPKSWIDIGTGGGFPGAVLAILAQESGTPSVTLVESNNKKAAFLRNALSELAPRARVICERAEEVVDRTPAPDAVSARALADFAALIRLCEPWLERETTGFFHKGRDYRAEIKLVHDTWNLDLVEHASVIDPESVVLEVRNVRRKM